MVIGSQPSFLAVAQRVRIATSRRFPWNQRLEPGLLTERHSIGRTSASSRLATPRERVVPNWRNQMVPMSPSFQWDHRRRDNGNPLGVTWIGQHCALVWLIPFCRIGHIKTNGELFEHIQDPKER